MNLVALIPSFGVEHGGRQLTTTPVSCEQVVVITLALLEIDPESLYNARKFFKTGPICMNLDSIAVPACCDA